MANAADAENLPLLRQGERIETAPDLDGLMMIRSRIAISPCFGRGSGLKLLDVQPLARNLGRESPLASAGGAD